jgi:glucose-1-phosphate cytidylyltransferase
MKAVILAGGRGTRLAEETTLKPKPLVEANGRPLIWHIMQNYYRHGISEFIVLSGYKGQQIREYFANFWLHQADLTFDLSTSNQEILKVRGLPWKVTVLDTGIDTNTGGRIARLKGSLEEDFLLTYGDGVADIDIEGLLSSHRKSNNVATLTAVQPPARFGALNLSGNRVVSFQEKPEGEGAWVNGGFFAFTPKIFDYLRGDNSSLEFDALPKVASDGKLGFYKHSGFWQPVDTIRDLQRLEEAIELGALPWS